MGNPPVESKEKMANGDGSKPTLGSLAILIALWTGLIGLFATGATSMAVHMYSHERHVTDELKHAIGQHLSNSEQHQNQEVKNAMMDARIRESFKGINFPYNAAEQNKVDELWDQRNEHKRIRERLDELEAKVDALCIELGKGP